MLYGIERPPFVQDIELSLLYPARIAEALKDGSIDLGLMPVAAIPQIPGGRIVSSFGIAADRHVASVCIFSQVPIEKVERLYLDYQSRTSVRLAQVLLEHYWKHKVELLAAPEDYIELIDGTTAGVVIGDRALRILDRYPYVYDLAEHWALFTGLPFVFAAWVANKELPASFLERFEEANALGLSRLESIASEHPFPYYDLFKYYKENIQFRLGPLHKKGLELFWAYLDKADGSWFR